MPTYQSSPPYEHGLPESLGVLLVNLGTPDAPTPTAVRRFLKDFLWDPRVVETPRALWWLILHGVILQIRPARSARAYSKIWSDKGSPLLLHSQEIANAMQTHLSARLPGTVNVGLGMSYGQPSIASALDRLHTGGARRIILLPLYPQYSGTTTASVFDAVSAALSARRWVPEFRFINQYHDASAYIAANAANVREYWEQHDRGNKLLFSFHGLPRKTLLDGDPYHCQCQKTARLIAAALELGDDDWQVVFQSRVGREEWLRPYADETISELGNSGVDRVDVVCPGFAADCLETLEEIAIRYAALFKANGGNTLHYIPALNARDDHTTFLARLVEKHAGGWPEAISDGSVGESNTQQQKSRQRALAMGAKQ